LIIHSLWFHENPQDPKTRLPEINSDDDKLYDISKNIYESSLSRINKLEEKSFKLLSYYTALFALLSFMYLQTPSNSNIKALIILSLVPSLVSIGISFRCINIKSTKNIFIDSVYELEKEVPTEEFNKKNLIKSFLECAIFNENVADNTVDMLNGARYTLVLSLFFCMITLFIVVNNGSENKKSQYEAKTVENLSLISKEMNLIANRIDSLRVKENEINVLKGNIVLLKKTLDSKKIIKSSQKK
jgi:hypothetical protein